ncbi:hypothetical protein E1A91_A06G142500v1 [Gossypium mustelinum]|uniref:Uncharacterized protein n=1 Tax=Gossypium mustelinum TaxID=34275 RepID=A0A5D2YWF8_GOSMU|nr:hypothetical protein E1A91_A06G142500v1 [Gossypium mustelinum]
MLLNPPISSFSLQPKRPSSAHSIAAVASGRRCGERAFKLHLQRPSRRLNLQQPKSEEKGSSLSLCRTRLQRWRNHSDGEIERDSGERFFLWIQVQDALVLGVRRMEARVAVVWRR